jgi:hypothetical protein
MGFATGCISMGGQNKNQWWRNKLKINRPTELVDRSKIPGLWQIARATFIRSNVNAFAVIRLAT